MKQLTNVLCVLLAFIAIFYMVIGDDTKATMFICICILNEVSELRGKQ